MAHPHDRTIKYATELPGFGAWLGVALREVLGDIVVHDVQREPTELASSSSTRHADIILIVRFRRRRHSRGRARMVGRPSSRRMPRPDLRTVAVVVEHLSRPDRRAGLRMGRYMIRAWLRRPRVPLIGLVIYTGATPWAPVTTALPAGNEDLEGVAVSWRWAFAPLVHAPHLVEAADPELRVLFALVARPRRVTPLDVLAERQGDVRAALVDPPDEWIEHVISYIVEVEREVVSPHVLRERLMSLPEIEEDVMSWASTVRKQGRDEGREEGREEGRRQGREEGRDEGRHEQAVSVLVRLGTQRLGPAPEAVLRALDVNTLDSMLMRLLSASSWDELLAGA